MSAFKVQSINRHRMLVDGEGVTTLVGLKMCPLSCKYCINKKNLASPVCTLMQPTELLSKVMVDYCYFVSTGGGVTFGGGESLCHAEAILDFIAVRPVGMTVNLETSLQVDTEKARELLTAADALIIDIKTLDSAVYEAYTGCSPQIMRKNLAYLCEQKLQDKCLIRIPIIPSYKEEAVALKEEEEIHKMGFHSTEVFPYIIREE